MDSITFQANVNDEQVIRPPADVLLPLGDLEVTVRPLSHAATSSAVAAANGRLSAIRCEENKHPRALPQGSWRPDRGYAPFAKRESDTRPNSTAAGYKISTMNAAMIAERIAM